MGTTVMPVYSNADLVFNTRLEKIPLFTTTPIIGAGTSNQGLRRAAARSALLRLPFTQPSAPYNKPPKNESHSHGGGSSGGYPAPAYASPFASLVPSTFPPRTNPNLVAIAYLTPLKAGSGLDTIIWKGEIDGCFLTKSAYDLVCQHQAGAEINNLKLVNSG
ncbi:hypothetical protein JHK85_016398 [Glycine max]|nr:hypothetical protein JHK85_016398 [Glycine max]KAG5046619.1 hypothetical protein JHK86_016025 [Glycine max]